MKKQDKRLRHFSDFFFIAAKNGSFVRVELFLFDFLFSHNPLFFSSLLSLSSWWFERVLCKVKSHVTNKTTGPGGLRVLDQEKVLSWCKTQGPKKPIVASFFLSLSLSPQGDRKEGTEEEVSNNQT